MTKHYDYEHALDAQLRWKRNRTILLLVIAVAILVVSVFVGLR